MLPAVSIVMAVYNEEATISGAIESIFSQTFTDWELIIINDGSTDATPDIIQKYADHSRKVNIITNELNLGLPASLNKGIEYAKAALIARADADDINLPERLEKQYVYMQKHPEVDVLGTGAFLLGSDRVRIRAVVLPKTHEELASLPVLKTHFFHSSVFIRRGFFEKAGLYDIAYARAQDKELWIRGLQAGCFYGNLQEPLIEYSTDDYVRSWRSIINQTRSLLRMVRFHRIKGGYRMVLLSVGYSTLVKFRCYRPVTMRVL